MIRRYDVVILGAGIVGCACAAECAKAGLRVAILEPSVLGGGTTAAGMGHVVAMDDSPAQLALTRFSRDVWAELAPVLPESVEYERRGTIWVAADAEEMAEVHTKHVTCTAAGICAETLDAQQLAEAEPNLRKGLAGGLLVPDDAVLYPPAAAAHLLNDAMRMGAESLRGVAAVEIGEGWVRLSDGSRMDSDFIVMATGSDCSLMPWLPVQRRKGHLVITDRYPGFVHHQLVELGYLKSAHKVAADSVAFNVQPRRTGQILIGSSRQYGSEDGAVEPKILSEMLERARGYMPRIASLSSIRVWTGFRAATPDKLPLIGPAPMRGVYLAMGFEGLGITNAPGAARLLVDQLLKRECGIDATPYLPSRIRVTEAMYA